MPNSADPDQLASDLDLHCLLVQGMSCSAREGLSIVEMDIKHQFIIIIIIIIVTLNMVFG